MESYYEILELLYHSVRCCDGQKGRKLVFSLFVVSRKSSQKVFDGKKGVCNKYGFVMQALLYQPQVGITTDTTLTANPRPHPSHASTVSYTTPTIGKLSQHST